MLWLLLWAPLSFFAHNLLHEGAHWAAIRAMGGKATIIPYPRIIAGRVYFGQTLWVVPAQFREAQFLAAYFAPVLVEMLWIVIAAWAYGYCDWAALEAGAALLDIAVWAFGADGHRVRDILA